MKKGIIISTLAAVMLGVVISIAYAITGPYQLPPFDRRKCLCGGTVDITGFGTLPASGNITAEWVANSATGEPRPWADVRVAEFTNNQPGLAWSIDASRPLISRIRADFAGSAFPATANFRVHALMSTPGVQYRTMPGSEIHFRATINSWPNNNTPYHQVGVAHLERVDKPGEIAFTVSNIQVNVTQEQN